jgi:hypothetical protein
VIRSAIIAAVGFNGRESRMSMATHALAFMLLLAPLSAQPRSPFQDLASELAAKIAARLPAGEPVAVVAEQAGLEEMRTDVARGLASRGARVLGAGFGRHLPAGLSVPGIESGSIAGASSRPERSPRTGGLRPRTGPAALSPLAVALS